MNKIKQNLFYLMLFFGVPLVVLASVLQLATEFSFQADYWDAKNSLLSIFGVSQSEPEDLPLPQLTIVVNEDTDNLGTPSEITYSGQVNSKDAQVLNDQDSDPGKIPMEFYDMSVSEADVLQDKYDRVRPDFKVPAGLQKRVAFWFDIYSKYTSRFAVIHDSRNPWIIYAVVDTRPVFDNTRSSRMAKSIFAERAIDLEFKGTKNLLLGLSKKSKSKRLSRAEQKLVALVNPSKKTWKKDFLAAASAMRVQTGQKDFFRQGLISGSKYLGEMEEIFARYDLPSELVRLPLVESSFNEDAVSKVGASGVWQFMPSTGKQFLSVSPLIDERNSPIKATDAAAQLMLDNFQLLKSWPLAVTAYNHGPGGLMSAAKAFNTTALTEIIKKNKSKSFGFASQNFYSEFLAALHAEKYHEEIFGDVGKHPPLVAEQMVLPRKVTVNKLITRLGITIEQLKLYNPELKSRQIGKTTVLPAAMKIRIPPDAFERAKAFTENSNEFFGFLKRNG